MRCPFWKLETIVSLSVSNLKRDDDRVRFFRLFVLSFSILVAPAAFPQKGSRHIRPKPVETNVCKILENPSAFNNKLVRVRGFVSVSFEYSTLQDEACSDAIWFALSDGSGPPGLVATVNGTGKPGGNNSKRTSTPPLPVKLVRDANFEKFRHYLEVRAEGNPGIDDPSLPTGSDCCVEHVTATFTGRIDSVSKELHAAHQKRTGRDSPDFKGFGQMGMFDTQLVVES